MGAWIETSIPLRELPVLMSHPEWVRGLKLVSHLPSARHIRSHPEWVRGLKLGEGIVNLTLIVSHPEWVRGLKPYP